MNAVASPALRFRGLGYTRARQLVLWAGVGVLLLIAGVAYARRVDTTEVFATLLFIPVFVALLFWRTYGGLVVGTAAAVVYLSLKAPAVRTVGFEFFARSIVVRALSYPLFGVLGGWASRQVQSALTKLELFDQIDDATGLYNARFFVQDADLEMSRSDRYHTIFSVGLVDIPAAGLAQLGRRQADRMLHAVGRLLRDGVRKVDRPAHGRDRDRHRVVVVLPETAGEGARIFTERMADKVRTLLWERGLPLQPGNMPWAALTYPEDKDELRKLQAEFREIDRFEHPEESGKASAAG